MRGQELERVRILIRAYGPCSLETGGFQEMNQTDDDSTQDLNYLSAGLISSKMDQRVAWKKAF